MRMKLCALARLGMLVLAGMTQAQSADRLLPVAPEPVDVARLVVAGPTGAKRPLGEVLPPGPAIVHFWTTWCPPCRDELPAVERFAAMLTSTGLAERLVVVSVDHIAYARIAAFLRADLGLQALESWLDVSRKAGTAFRLFGYPNTVLLDAAHRIVGRHPGPLAWDDPDIRAQLLRHLRVAE